MAITSTTAKDNYHDRGQGAIKTHVWTVTIVDEAGDTANQYYMDSLDLRFGGKYNEPLRVRVEVKRTDAANVVIDAIALHGSDVDPSISADDPVTDNIDADDLAGLATSTYDLTDSDTQNWTSGPVVYAVGVPRYIALAIDSPAEIINATVVITAVYG